MTEQTSFYERKAKKYNRYNSFSREIPTEGEVPSFFDLLKSYANRDRRVLDLGCGSGELTLRLAPYFGEIVGLDPIERYLKTANQDKAHLGIRNINFVMGDAIKMGFSDESFDLVYSARGPLTANIQFLKESLRVLKRGGRILEETIGEDDKLEVKKIFGRGQRYPFQTKKIDEIRSLLEELNLGFEFTKYYLYFSYLTRAQVVELLDKAPIIPDFDEEKDQSKLDILEKEKKTKRGIELSSHRFHWAAKK